MNVAIVGGSLTGLSAATVLLRLGISVTVFEKFPNTFEKRGSSLGKQFSQFVNNTLSPLGGPWSEGDSD